MDTAFAMSITADTGMKGLVATLGLAATGVLLSAHTGQGTASQTGRSSGIEGDRIGTRQSPENTSGDVADVIFSAGKPGRISANRILDMPRGEQLPRIC
jgi:hypothetical protein